MNDKINLLIDTFIEFIIIDKKQTLLDHIAELDKFADQLLMMEYDEDRELGVVVKDNLSEIKAIIEESLL